MPLVARAAHASPTLLPGKQMGSRGLHMALPSTTASAATLLSDLLAIVFFAALALLRHCCHGTFQSWAKSNYFCISNLISELHLPWYHYWMCFLGARVMCKTLQIIIQFFFFFLSLSPSFSSPLTVKCQIRFSALTLQHRHCYSWYTGDSLCAWKRTPSTGFFHF